MGALDVVALHAHTLVRYPQAVEHGLFAVRHYLRRDILAARTVAPLTLHPVLEMKGVVLFPSFRVVRSHMADQASRRSLRFFGNAAQLGDSFGLRAP